MKRIVSVVSARPNFVKLAAVHHALREHAPGVEHLIVHTGQHYDPLLSDVFFAQLEIPLPQVNLGVHGEDREEVIARTEAALTPHLQEPHPDVVLVYGDVNGALGAAQSANVAQVPLAHIEAGLRSFDSSMPEEHNRIAVDRLANLLFCTEQSGMDNLKKEKIPGQRFLIGNTMIDTLMRMMSQIKKEPRVPYGLPHRYGVVTLHRPSNVDDEENLGFILAFLAEVAKEVPLILPVHHRLRRALARLNLPPGLFANIRRTDPLGYVQFLCHVRAAALVLTDSGGIQEEAAFLRKRCFTLRKNTERPCTLEENGGSNTLIDLEQEGDRQKVFAYAQRPVPVDVHLPKEWDGNAGGRIIDVLKTFLQKQ